MQTQPSAIQVVGVTQHYGVRPILKDVDMTVRRGELVAIMGPNGSGKSTLMGVLAGALSPYRGYVQINGLRRRRTAEEELAIRKQVVFLPAEPWLPHTRPGLEWVLAVGRLWGVDDDRVMDHAQRLIDLFDLTEKADAPIASYSTGQRKKLALSAALITDAPILLLDEPFAGGLDPSGILALKRVLAHHAEQASATIVMATPVPELVEELADRVAVMREGRLVAFDTVAELRRQANCTGALDRVYELLVSPDTSDKVARYFDAPTPTGKAARQ